MKKFKATQAVAPVGGAPTLHGRSLPSAARPSCSFNQLGNFGAADHEPPPPTGASPLCAAPRSASVVLQAAHPIIACKIFFEQQLAETY